MATDYEKLYRETANALGRPSQVFVEFFETYSQPGASVLDVGCGQGRDAVFIARLGHHVTGIDTSPSGIASMLSTGVDEDLPITGIVADIRDFQPDREFDVILLDRTLHMLDEPDRLKVLTKLTQHVCVDGYLLIADERSNRAAFDRILNASQRRWTPIIDKGGTLFVKRDR